MSIEYKEHIFGLQEEINTLMNSVSNLNKEIDLTRIKNKMLNSTLEDYIEEVKRLNEEENISSKKVYKLETDLDELEMVQNAKNGKELKEAIEFIGKNRNHQVPGRTKMFKMDEQLNAIDKVIEGKIAPNYLTRRFGIRQQAMMLGFYENKGKELASLIDTVNVQSKLDRVLSNIDAMEKFRYLYSPVFNGEYRSFNGWEYDWTDEEDMEALNAAPNNCIWTVIEGDEGMYIAAGSHIVNRLAYIITKYPWETGEEQYKFD